MLLWTLAVQPALAAITIAEIGSFTAGGDNPSYTSASITPTANKLLIFCGYFEDGGTADSITSITDTFGTGNTWSAILNATSAYTGSANRRLFMYATRLPGSVSSGTVTVNLSGTVGGLIGKIMQVSGEDTSGTNGSGAILQGAGANATSTTLSAFYDSTKDVTLGCWENRAIATLTVEDGTWNLIGSVRSSTSCGGDCSIQAAYKVGEDVTPSATWSGTPSGLGIMAIELKDVAASPPTSGGGMLMRGVGE